MTRLVVATTNLDKLREIERLLEDAPVQLLSLQALPPIPEPDETGLTFEDNARLKALYYARHAERLGGDDLLTVAEDSGLEIDALGGEPGVRSARFLRPDATYPERFAEIFRRLEARPHEPRTARFVCALAVVDRGRIRYEARGTIEGQIAREARGTGGFGYDPIFFYPPYGLTLGEATSEAKLRVAHRGVAFRALGEWLKERRTENRD
jgi:XTP/dITP diphosphohydrolase